MLETLFKTTVLKEEKLKDEQGVEAGTYFQVEIEPLEQGFGSTVGNALRRVLLSSIKGAAVVQVKIKGVSHQFTTLSGMSEDVVDFILNVKQMRLSMGDMESAKLTLSAKGPGIVLAKDVALPGGVEVANPSLVLANLADKKASLEVEMEAKTGVGYVAAEIGEESMLGVIPVDAFYSPITKVAYKVEATRVGRRTDFDKLIMEIWTDGTVDAKDALEEAAKMLVVHFKQIYDPADSPKEKRADKVVVENESMNLTVEELDVPTRIANALRRGGYKTVLDLAEASEEEIAKVKNLGGKSVGVVAKALKKKGVEFKS